MTCEELNGLLDRLMDDELTEDERQAMIAHGAECPDCAEAIRATLQMKALFEEMEPEVDVPLAVQARWRGAVREEAARSKKRRLTRWIGSVAAAVVVLVGVGLAVNGGLAPRNAALQTKTSEAAGEAELAEAEYEEAPQVEVIEADGESAVLAAPELEEEAMPMAAEEADLAFEAEEEIVIAEGATSALDEGEGVASEEADAVNDFSIRLGETSCAAVAKQAPAIELTLHVEDVEDACRVASDLAGEFDGVADVQAVEGGSANVYVELYAREAGDFLKAVAKLDASESAPALPDVPEEGSLLVLLVIEPME